MRPFFRLTETQIAHLRAAAATLRVDQRDAFMRDVERELARHDRAPTDAELSEVISATNGIVPVFLCDGGTKQRGNR